LKRALTGALVVAVLLVAGCDRQDQGPVRVTAIGEKPKLVDPSTGPLDNPESILVQNAAQGLVRFDAQGNIVPGLAERWNVSDDGLSYIFRLQSGEWPSGREITAQDVARLLRRQLAAQSRNSLKDAVGAVAEVVAMTDRVIEIRLSAPRSHLLQLLAQPEFGLVRNGEGAGPFQIKSSDEDSVQLARILPGPEGEEAASEEVKLKAAKTAAAVQAFVAGKTEMVLGGTYADLPIATRAKLPRNSLRFDPVAGLFGFMPARKGGLLADPEVRALLDRALDRQALVAALTVPDLESRASVLQPGLDGNISPAVPAWAATPVAERRTALLPEARRLIAPDEEGAEPPVIRVALPEGPGSDIILQRLRADWGPLGLRVERAESGRPADLRLVDLVAPSVSPAWFLRQFRCEVAPICSEEADALLDAARAASVAPQRSALFAEAERQIREQTLFIPVAAPVRWSLVARGLPGFAENRFARHTLVALRGGTDEE
jgi:oligopeptide transport system substrate-binding protein